MTTPARRGARTAAVVAAAILALTASVLAAPAATAAIVAPTQAAASAAPSDGTRLTNLAHLDFLLDAAEPDVTASHTTYRLAEEPTVTVPWTYADARDGGTFELIGGGQVDPATGDWSQGAYNADDISRAAIVYIRDWEQTGSESSRASAYGLLRGLTYLQTLDGPNAGNVVLWMQPDGSLNASAEPVELPDPSDSGPSYWLARTIWALGEGYAAFQDADPEFAGFLEERLALSLGAVEREVLGRYGEWAESDGMRVPAWLIVDGADASAEAVLGLAARVGARPDDTRSADALRKLAEGIAAMSAGDVKSWPYGAVLPWAQSRSMWHAWGSQMPAALAAASAVLGDDALLEPALADGAVFTPTLLTAGGPDNGWFPTPTDRVQIAYGADSRVQSLLELADTAGSQGFADLAGIQAAWFFGGNHAGAVMYDPATGVTYDGLAPDGTVNRNSGAESAIHGLLTMLALDAHPDVRERAVALTSVESRDGLRMVEAETAETDGTVTTPESWTGESSWSGSALSLTRGQRALIDIPGDGARRWIEPVVWSDDFAGSRSSWRAGVQPLGQLRESAPEQGISPTFGVLLPRQLPLPSLLRGNDTVRVEVRSGELTLDGVLVRPWVSRLVLAGDDASSELVHSAAGVPQPVRVGAGTVRVYDSSGSLVREQTVARERAVVLPAGGFLVAER